MWIGPKDQKEVDPRNPNGAKEGPQFPTSFLSDNAITRQKAAYEQQVKGHTMNKGRRRMPSRCSPCRRTPRWLAAAR
ncbi:Uncharacterised protein [Serratia liquefaciens]|nr:Uncharacterised protein [Serratia liquefaciens]